MPIPSQLFCCSTMIMSSIPSLSLNSILEVIFYTHTNARMHARTHTHTHTTILRPSWILSGTAWVSQHQKDKTNLDLLKQEIVSGSGISCAICKSAHWPRHITMPASHHQFFTGQMPFQPPSQQRQSTEGIPSFTLTSHIHLTILFFACWSSTSFYFLTGQVSVPWNILLCMLMPYTKVVNRIDYCTERKHLLHLHQFRMSPHTENHQDPVCQFLTSLHPENCRDTTMCQFLTSRLTKIYQNKHFWMIPPSQLSTHVLGSGWWKTSHQLRASGNDCML